MPACIGPANKTVGQIFDTETHHTFGQETRLNERLWKQFYSQNQSHRTRRKHSNELYVLIMYVFSSLTVLLSLQYLVHRQDHRQASILECSPRNKVPTLLRFLDRNIRLRNKRFPCHSHGNSVLQQFIRCAITRIYPLFVLMEEVRHS